MDVLFLLFLLCQQVTPDAVITEHETIPRWQDAVELEGTLTGDQDFDSIEVHANLTITDCNLDVTNIMVMPGASLTVEGDTTVTFKDVPLVDEQEFSNGLIVFGSLNVNGSYKTPFVKCDGPLQAGDTFIPATLPFDWVADDQLLIPETRQTQFKKTRVRHYESEVITLGEPLQYDHPGMSPNPCMMERYPAIANLDRQVVFKSANPEGVRGHVMLTAHASVNINGVAFLNLGRTEAEPIRSFNIAGRYPIHLHHLHGEGPHIINNCVVVDGKKWSIAVHDTSNAVLTDNVIYLFDGAGIVQEDGNEYNCQYIRNYICTGLGGWQLDQGRAGARRQPNPETGQVQVETGSDGSGFWIRRSAGTYIDNLVYACDGYAYNFNGYYSNNTGEFHPTQQLTEFRGNEACSSKGGLWFTWTQRFTGGGFSDWGLNVVDDFVGWNINERGVHCFHEANIQFNRCSLVNDPVTSQTNSGSGTSSTARTGIGFHFGNPSYENFDMEFNMCGAFGYNVGVSIPERYGQAFVWNGGMLSNFVNFAYFPDAPLEALQSHCIFYIPSAVGQMDGDYQFFNEPANIWHWSLGVIEPGQVIGE